MEKYYKFLLLAGAMFLLIFSQQSCKKDDVDCLNCDHCENFPEQKGIATQNFSQKSFQRKAPYFNPNNSNEFIYIIEEGNIQTLVKHNLATKQEVVLLENAQISGQPKWSENGLILFSRNNLQIHLLKDNGDSLNQITHFYQNTHPSFHGREKIFFAVGTETSPGVTGNKLIDYFDNRIDSTKSSDIGCTMGINDINSIDEITSMVCSNDNTYSISSFSMGDKKFNQILNFEFTGRNNITGICWHPNDNDIYYSTYREGLYVINKNTKNRSKIRNGCDSRSYRHLSVSPDGTKILVERVDASNYKNNNGSWTEEAKIYIMDIDGENERDVFK